MLKPISQLEEAFRDTTVHKAEGKRVDKVADLYGMPRPEWIVRQRWRDALKKTALGPRGVSQTLFLFLRYGLQQLQEKITVTVGSDTASFSVTAATSVFTNKHVGRLCILQDSEGVEQVFYSVADTPFLNSQVDLKFSGTATGAFNACPENLTTGTYTLFILPFLIFELTPSVVYPTPLEVNGVLQGGTNSIPKYFLGNKKDAARILVRLFGTAFDVPGTFVQLLNDLTSLEDFVPPANLGGPDGGYVQTDVSVTQYNDGNLNHPIYLGEGIKNANLLINILRQNFLAAAVQIDFEQLELADFD